MNILYVFAHPEPTSFNAQLKEVGLQQLNKMQHAIQLSDLYQQQFNPLATSQDFNLNDVLLGSQYFMKKKAAFEQNKLAIDIQEEIKKIEWADHLVLHFPLWWFSVPAILKGWLDRVLVKGFAYDTGKTFINGLLTGKSASLVLTTQSPEEAYQKEGVHKQDINAFLLPIHHTLRFAGIKTIDPFVSYAVFNLDETRQGLIFKEYELYLKSNLITK